MIYQKIMEEYHFIQEEIQSLQKQIAKLPEGKLICSHGKNCFKWHKSDGHTKTSIPKKDREVAEKLAIKKYLTLELEALKQEQTAIEFYLRHHSQDSGKAEELLREHAGYRELLEPYFKSESWRLAEWANEGYDKNLSHLEHLIHKTSAGILVRSKSEAMIVHALYTNQIPFRYEYALPLASTTIYPDFTIRHSRTGETFYWEHFGMMGDPDYSQKAFSRMQLYNSNGIIPSIHLITTFETLEYPLNHETIEKIVKEYFL